MIWLGVFPALDAFPPRLSLKPASTLVSSQNQALFLVDSLGRIIIIFVIAIYYYWLMMTNSY